MKPLSGETILVTRPRRQAGELAAELRRRGADVILAPAIRLGPPKTWGPLDRALRGLGRFDDVVFTSANAVEAFFARARSAVGSLPEPLPRAWAIGPATARALRERGWRGVRTPPVRASSELPGRMGSLKGRRVLLPRAESAGKELPRLLKESGARLTQAQAYRTLPDPAGLRRLRRAVTGREASWIVFTSASTVENFMSSMGSAKARDCFGRARAASIGPVTSEALRRAGVRPSAEAAGFEPARIAEAIAVCGRPPETPALRRVLRRAILDAGAILRAKFGKVRIRYKGKANLVTEADHASEACILRAILREFPDHDFMTEERDPRVRGSDFLWIIDPLDGTTNYAHGFPIACVSIGLLHRGQPLLGGVYDPFRDELFLACRGLGATLNGRAISVSRTINLDECLFLTGFAYDRGARARYYLNFYRDFMERSHDVRRTGAAALDLAWVAAGRAEGFWEFNLKPWDVAAGMLLVTEAGGRVTDFRDEAFSLMEPDEIGRQTLASNGALHPAMLRVIRHNL